jgi:SAM-dependent methyltransferase
MAEGGIYNQGAVLETYTELLRKAGDFENKLVLDLGCGSGWSSIEYARRGAFVVGIDISEGTLKQAQNLCIKENCRDRVCLVKSSAEMLPFKKSFDKIIGIAVLHHLDFNLAMGSIELALKDGGRALFMEPLAHNPLINLYRWLTPSKRTVDEKPLDIELIRLLKQRFHEVALEGYGLLSILSFVFVLFKAHGLFRVFHAWLSKVDRRIMKVFPGIQKYCWGVVIEIHTKRCCH